MLRKQRTSRTRKANRKLPLTGDKDEGPPDQPLFHATEGSNAVKKSPPLQRDLPEGDKALSLEGHRNKEKRESSNLLSHADKIELKSGDPMSDSPSGEEVAARLEAVEARSDTKFAQLLGEIRTEFAVISTRLNSLERATAGTKVTIIGTSIGAVAVIIAVLAYGQTWFGIGVTNRDTIKAIVTEVIQQQTPPRTK